MTMETPINERRPIGCQARPWLQAMGPEIAAWIETTTQHLQGALGGAVAHILAPAGQVEQAGIGASLTIRCTGAAAASRSWR